MRDLPRIEDENLIVGTDGFSDAAVYRLRDDLYIVQSLDFFPPLVDDPYLFGQIAAANSLSDIYAMGAQPVTALNIVGFPDDQLELEVLNEILKGGASRVAEAGAVVGGGHTVRDAEIKFGLSATGVVHPDNLLTNQGAQPGDVLVLTKALGTGFVTTAFKMSKCPDEVIQNAGESMAQLNAAASKAAVEHKASAVTDITGFGLAGHAGEMAQSSNVTLKLRLNQLPLLPGADELAAKGNKTRASATNRNFSQSMTRMEEGLDDLLLEFIFDAQTSGGLLISIAADRAEALAAQAREHGATVTAIIGEVVDKQDVSLVIEP